MDSSNSIIITARIFITGILML